MHIIGEFYSICKYMSEYIVKEDICIVYCFRIPFYNNDVGYKSMNSLLPSNFDSQEPRL